MIIADELVYAWKWQVDTKLENLLTGLEKNKFSDGRKTFFRKRINPATEEELVVYIHAWVLTVLIWSLKRNHFDVMNSGFYPAVEKWLQNFSKRFESDPETNLNFSVTFDKYLDLLTGFEGDEQKSRNEFLIDNCCNTIIELVPDISRLKIYPTILTFHKTIDDSVVRLLNEI